MRTAKYVTSGTIGLSAVFLVTHGFSQQPAAIPNISSVVNLASGDAALAPGTLVAIFGSNLTFQQPDTVPVSVSVNGLPGAVLNATPQQLTVELPIEAHPGPATLQLESQQSLSPPYSLTLQTYSPGIFTTTGNLGSLWHSDGTAVTLANPARPGEAISLLCTGLGPTNPVIPTGTPAPTNPQASVLTLPGVMIGTQSAQVQGANLEQGTVGKYRVFFPVPLSLSAGSYELSLQVGGQISNSVVVPVTGLGNPTIDSIVSAASFASAALAAPGSIVSILGLNFGQNDNLSIFPATSASGVSVSINGIQVPLFAVVPSANQINAYVPSELPSIGTVTVTVNTAAGVSTAFDLQMAPASPGIFRIPDPSGVVKNNGAVTFANTAWLAVPQSLANALRIPTNCESSGINPASVCGQPATSGDILTIFATGLGQATPGGLPGGNPLPTGSVAPVDGNPLYETIDSPLVSIGAVPAPVLFSGLAPGYAGLYQINIRVPAGVPTADQVVLQVATLNGLSDSVTIAIQ
jgi:uncharacterized protein (TIGR03437 family)